MVSFIPNSNIHSTKENIKKSNQKRTLSLDSNCSSTYCSTKLFEGDLLKKKRKNKKEPCEICLNVIKNDFSPENSSMFRCKLCKCIAHFSCIEEISNMNYAKDTNLCNVCYEFEVNQIIFNRECRLCYKSNGFLLKSDNNYWIHPICLYSTNGYFVDYKKENRIILSEIFFSNTEKCLDCQSEKGYLNINKFHPSCSVKRRNDYCLYYKNTLLQKYEKGRVVNYQKLLKIKLKYMKIIHINDNK